MSSGWTLIGSDLSSSNFNSSVRAKRSFAMHYLNVVIKPFRGNLEICLTTRLTPAFGRGILFTCFSRRPRLKVKDAFWITLFGRVLAQFSRFRNRNPFRSRKALAYECTYYPVMLHLLSYPTIPLSHSALPTELSHYPTMLYQLSYPAIP